MKYAILLALPLLFTASCTAPHAHNRGRQVVVKKVHKHGPGWGHHLRAGVWVRL